MNGNMIYFAMDAAAKTTAYEQQLSEPMTEPRFKLSFAFLKKWERKPKPEPRQPQPITLQANSEC